MKEIDVSQFAKAGECLAHIKELNHQSQVQAAVALSQAAVAHFGSKDEDYYRIVLYDAFLHFLRGDKNRLYATATYYNLMDFNRYLKLKAEVLGFLGIYYQDRGDLERAAKSYRQAVELKQRQGQDKSVIKLKINLATLERDLKNFDQAIEILYEVLGWVKVNQSEQRLLVCTLLELARVKHQQLEFDMAIRFLKQACRLAGENGFLSEQGDIYREAARISLKKDNQTRVRNFYYEALSAYQKSGHQLKADELIKEFENELR